MATKKKSKKKSSKKSADQPSGKKRGKSTKKTPAKGNGAKGRNAKKTAAKGDGTRKTAAKAKKSPKKTSKPKARRETPEHKRIRENGSPTLDAHDREVASRYDSFADLAQRRAEGHFVVLPRNLTEEERHMHVRQTLREDHRTRIHQHRADAGAKFDKLAGSVYSFFRGTCLLFYRDMAGEDAWMPTVLTLGDVHPENFGVMPSIDNTPIFGVNDFDEAYYAPFTWDLKRGAVGFMVAAKERGIHKKKRRRIVRELLDGYFDGMEEFQKENAERDQQVRMDNAPPLIRDLLEKSLREREGWLKKYTGEKGLFVSSDDLVPLSSRKEEFQAIVDAYAKQSHVNPPPRAGDLVVKDVAEKKGSGTASLGLPRYFVLLEGPSSDGTDDIILEMKRARRSALAGLAPPSQYEEDGEADRIVNAQAVHLVGGDPFYGKAIIDGQSFLVRERSPFKEEIDIDDLSKKQWRTYACICGRSLAHAHSLADDSGAVDVDIEPMILEAAEPRELFYEDIIRFAEAALKRVYRDHDCFKADQALDAFTTVDVVYE